MLFVILFSIITLENPVKVNDSSPLPWFVGAEPPTPKNTVLVFVHGKGGSEKGWFENTVLHGHNDMYELAYNAGYRTAFVRLGKETTMWYNGRVLAAQIENIGRYFNTRNIVIIAHSKGGVDAEASLVYYNAIGAPHKIISLSTPYYGSPLADLVFSNLFTFWLSMVIGEATPATFVLQTAYMYRFQQIMSNDPDNQYVHYYTLSGWDFGPFPLWLGGAYLSLCGCDNAHGGNDGMVCFNSAHVSFDNGNTHRVSLGANEDNERKWYFNHDNIRIGHNTWQYIDSLIESYPVKSIPTIHENNINFSKYITIKTTGYIKEGKGKSEFLVKPGTRLFIVKPSKSHVSLSKSTINFKKFKDTPIEYGEVKTNKLEKITTNGQSFIIGDERKSPLYVKYSPIVKNTLPHIILSNPNNNEIAYKMFIKQYSMSGKFEKDITLSGKVKSGSSMLLPLYDDALYNIHIKAQYGNNERDIVFTIIKETTINKKTTSKLTEIKSLKKGQSENTYYIDILGRRVRNLKRGILFKMRDNKRKTLIILN